MSKPLSSSTAGEPRQALGRPLTHAYPRLSQRRPDTQQQQQQPPLPSSISPLLLHDHPQSQVAGGGLPCEDGNRGGEEEEKVHERVFRRGRSLPPSLRHFKAVMAASTISHARRVLGAFLVLAGHQKLAILLLGSAVVFLLSAILLSILVFDKRNLTVVESQFQLPKVVFAPASTSEGQGGGRGWGEESCQLAALTPLLHPLLRSPHPSHLMPSMLSSFFSSWQAAATATAATPTPTPTPPSSLHLMFSSVVLHWYFCAASPTVFPDLEHDGADAYVGGGGGVYGGDRKVPAALRAVPLESRSLTEAFCLYRTRQEERRRAETMGRLLSQMDACGLARAPAASAVPSSHPTEPHEPLRQQQATTATVAAPRGLSITRATSDGSRRRDHAEEEDDEGEGISVVEPGIHTILHPTSAHVRGGDMSGAGHTTTTTAAAASSPRSMDFVYTYVNGTERGRLYRRTLWKHCATPLQTLEYLWFVHKGGAGGEGRGGRVDSLDDDDGLQEERELLTNLFSIFVGLHASSLGTARPTQQQGNEKREEVLTRLLSASATWTQCGPILQSILDSDGEVAHHHDGNHGNDDDDGMGREAGRRRRRVLTNGRLLELLSKPGGSGEDEVAFSTWTSTVDFTDSDADELRYSLRSVYQHTHHWHTGRYVVVLPSGQIPSWLDLAKNFLSSSYPSTAPASSSSSLLPSPFPRLSLVDQASLLPYGLALTADSFVIESYLYRLHALSDLFVYLNDDYFFRSRVELSDLVNELGGPVIRLTRVINDVDGPTSEDWADESEARRAFRYVWRTSALNTLAFTIHAMDIGLEAERGKGLGRDWAAMAAKRRSLYEEMPGQTIEELRQRAKDWASPVGSVQHALSQSHRYAHRQARRQGRLARAAWRDTPIITPAPLLGTSEEGKERSMASFFRAKEDLLSQHGMPRTFDPITYMSHTRPLQRYRRRYELHSPFVICRNMHRYLHRRWDIIGTPREEEEGEREGEGEDRFALAWRGWTHRERNSSDMLFPFLYTDHMLRAPWVAASDKYLSYLAQKEVYRRRTVAPTRTSSTEETRKAAAATTATATATPPPSVTIDLDNRDGCAPATLISGDRATRTVYTQFSDNKAENEAAMKHLRDKASQILFTNINSKYTDPAIAEDMKAWMKTEYPDPLPVEKTEKGRRRGKRKEMEEAGDDDGKAVQDWFHALMRLPLILLTSDSEGFCPLLRSLQMALPAYGADPDPGLPLVHLVAVVESAGRGDRRAAQIRRGKRVNPFRNFMPVVACGPYNASRVKLFSFRGGRLQASDTPGTADIPHVEARADEEATGDASDAAEELGRIVSSVLAYRAAAGSWTDTVSLFPPDDTSASSRIPLARALVIDTRGSGAHTTATTTATTSSSAAVAAAVGSLAVPGQLLALEDFRVLLLHTGRHRGKGRGGGGQQNRARRDLGDDDGDGGRAVTVAALIVARALEEEEGGERARATETAAAAAAVLPPCLCPSPSFLFSAPSTTPPSRTRPALRLYPTTTSRRDPPAGGSGNDDCLCEDADGAKRVASARVPPVQWVTGATEKDLLAQYPLPYIRFESPTAPVRWRW